MAVDLARITQLVNKTNQFNLTTRRYSDAEVDAFERDPRRLGWQMRLTDRFGDHGMICAVVVDTSDDAWSIHTWVMSCRVLQRGVEQAVMQALAERAAGSGARAALSPDFPADGPQRARGGLLPAPRVRKCTGESDGAVTYRIALPAAIALPGPIRVTLAAGADAPRPGARRA